MPVRTVISRCRGIATGCFFASGCPPPICPPCLIPCLRTLVIGNRFTVKATIQIESLGEDEYRVIVRESGDQTEHLVIAPAEYCESLTGGTIPVADLLRLSFEFLLDREPKESILRRFELPVIGRYFPEYEQAMKHRIAAE